MTNAYSMASDAASAAARVMRRTRRELPNALRAAGVQIAVVGMLLVPSLFAYLVADRALPASMSAGRALVVAALLVLAAFVFPGARVAAYERLDRAFFPERSDRRRALAGAIRDVATMVDVPLLARSLRERLREALDVYEVGLWLREAGSREYRLVAGADERGRAPAIVAAEAHALDDWISGARSGPRLVRVSPAGDDGVETTLRRMGARVCFPLWTETGALGVLVLGARVAGQPFLPDHLELLTVLANQVAVVAENVRLHEALNASNLKLSESREMLQRASRLSTVGTLAAGLVHEIRNPLAAVQTFLQILPERLTDPEITTDFREVALNEVRRVSTLVGELLNVARAQTVKFERTRLDHVVDQVIRLLRVAAERRQIELRRSGNPLPEAEADPARLTQALLNLVLNAIEASAPGTAVTIDTQVRVDEAGRTTAAFAVHDRGPGVPLDRREQIFQPFATTKASGTGLGLAVTRQIVADHGGRIDVDSEDGAGATFTVSVPLEHSPTLQ